MKRIILTGGSDGLGKEFAKKCIKDGIEIIVLSRNKPDYPCIHVKTDLSIEKDLISACNYIKDNYDEFDAVVNCAGTISLESIDSISYHDLDYVYKVNSMAPIFLISNLLPLIKKNGADILNVTSITSTMFDISADAMTYSSSKSALRSASIMLKKELDGYPSRVITFNPGGMNTGLVGKWNNDYSDMCKDWIDPVYVADIMKYVLSLPKQIEISEITIDRKK